MEATVAEAPMETHARKPAHPAAETTMEPTATKPTHVLRLCRRRESWGSDRSQEHGSSEKPSYRTHNTSSHDAMVGLGACCTTPFLKAIPGRPCIAQFPSVRCGDDPPGATGRKAISAAKELEPIPVWSLTLAPPPPSNSALKP